MVAALQAITGCTVSCPGNSASHRVALFDTSQDDVFPLLVGSLLLKYNASEARVVATRWFQAAREYLPSLAQSNPLPPTDLNVAIANSMFANMMQAVSRQAIGYQCTEEHPRAVSKLSWRSVMQDKGTS